MRLDPSSRRAWHGSTELALTAREFSLLETFMRRPGEVLSRFELLEHVWDDSYENRSNVIDVYVGYLRDKLDRPFGTQTLETVRGAGYRLRVDERRVAEARRARRAGARRRQRAVRPAAGAGAPDAVVRGRDGRAVRR